MTTYCNLTLTLDELHDLRDTLRGATLAVDSLVTVMPAGQADELRATAATLISVLDQCNRVHAVRCPAVNADNAERTDWPAGPIPLTPTDKPERKCDGSYDRTGDTFTCLGCGNQFIGMQTFRQHAPRGGK